MQILEYLGCDGCVTVHFVDLHLPTTVRSSYLSKVCGSMSVLAVEWYLMYLVIHAMQDMRHAVTWAGHRLLSACSDSNSSKDETG